MNNSRIFLGYLVFLLFFITGCVGTQQWIEMRQVKVDENIAVIEKIIYKAGKNLGTGDIQKSRELCDKAIQKLFAVKGHLNENEYERLHGEVALLRLKTNHYVHSEVKVIKSDLFPLVWNSRVEKWLNYYTGRGREHFLRWLERKTKYIVNVKEVLKEHNLPIDLAYVPIVESGYNPFARSRAGAVGLWQFMKRTGKTYGLDITYWSDERRDPYKSTVAAVKYLKKLYDEFESWELALAAYNMGENGVRRRIKKWQTNDYWELFLPSETENFVPKIMATIFIVKEPKLFGFNPSYKESQVYKEFEVKGAIDLRKVAKWCSINISEIQMLNPELRQMCTPPDTNYNLRIPVEAYPEFVKNYNSLDNDKKYLTKSEIDKRIRRRIIYRVRRGDSLWKISRKFKVSMRKLKKWNNLASNIIYPGQKLKIYRRGI